MDDSGVWVFLFLGFPFGILLLILALVALSRAKAATTQAAEIEAGAKGAVQRLWVELAALQARVIATETTLAETRKQLADAWTKGALVKPAASVASEEAAKSPDAGEVAQAPTGQDATGVLPIETIGSAVADAPLGTEEPPRVRDQPLSGAEEPPRVSDPIDPSTEAAGAPANAPTPADIPPAVAPPAAPPADVAPPLAAREEAPATLEERIGLVWFTRIGAVILLLGVAYFFKYAVDSAWIGPSGRVGLGFLAGLGVLGFAETSRARTKRVFTNAALGIGLAFLFVSAYAAHAFYDIVPASVAFAAVFVISLLGGALAVRHKGEAILIFSSIAALVTPALLSTGQDRPVALFGYVLLVTALTYVVAVRAVFRVAPWIGVVGSLILFLGWYEKFFDLSPRVAVSGGVFTPGAYFALSSRIVPGAFVLACAAQWLGIARVARARKIQGFGEIAYVVAASLFLHVGLTMLIHDQPIALAIGLAVLGAASVVVLRSEKRESLLSIPLVASFLALVPSIHGAGKENALMMMVGLSLWASVYLVALVAPLREKTGMARGLGLALLGVVGVFLGIVAAEVLADPQPRAFTYFLLGGSALYAILATVVAAPSLALGSMILTLLFLLLSMPAAGKVDTEFLALAIGWAAIYLAHSVFELFVRKSEATRTRLVIPSGAGIGFLILALTHTSDRDGILRSAFLAGTGAMFFALGATLLRTGTSRKAATFLLGQALAAFAAALAFLLSGGSITIAWVALATVVLLLGAREQDRLWVAGGSLLFFVALARLFVFDLEAPSAARELYFTSFGASGALFPRLLVNERSLSLLAMSVGLLLGARSLSRSADKPLHSLAVLPLVLGHAFVLTLLVLEGKQLLLSHPDVPAMADHFAFEQAAALFRSTEVTQQTQRAMITTLLFGLYAALLLGIGFGRRSAAHRYLGLALFALTLVKLALWDVWNLPRIQQIGVLMGIGALLLGASFLYARFGKRLVTLIREGAGPTTVILLVSLAGTRTAHATSPTSLFTHSCDVPGVSAPGLYSFVVGPDLWRATESATPFGDLRVLDVSGHELPYTTQRRPAAPAPSARHATLVDPVKLDAGGARAVLDLGPKPPRHDHVRLDIAGSGFARRTRVEVSNDEHDFHVIAEGGWVFRLEGTEGNSSSSDTLSYPPSDARYVRVSLLGGSDGRDLRITGGDVSIDPNAPAPPVIILPATIAQSGASAPAQGKGTNVVLDLGSRSAPIEEVTFVVGTPIFERRVSIEAGSAPTHGNWIGSGVLYRVDPSAPPSILSREGLTVSVRPTRARYLRVHIDDGDDPPLTVTSASVAFHPNEVVFRADAGGPVTLLLGESDETPPSYDLAATLDRIGGGNPARLTLGPVIQNPSWRPTEAPIPPPPPVTERHREWFIAAIIVVVAALGAWAIFLMRGARPDSKE